MHDLVLGGLGGLGELGGLGSIGITPLLTCPTTQDAEHQAAAAAIDGKARSALQRAEGLSGQVHLAPISIRQHLSWV